MTNPSKKIDGKSRTNRIKVNMLLQFIYTWTTRRNTPNKRDRECYTTFPYARKEVKMRHAVLTKLRGVWKCGKTLINFI